ncbi:hypothetical protein [Kitasatospora purpeofusca]|uniref:hypothetical protein n=1 Tax=Kitasatospora purpeofusca TaxID=67352 RepID=UPI00386F23F0|nr:hypothetical protein OIP63_02630 [Kitasatospora purpeofusca]
MPVAVPVLVAVAVPEGGLLEGRGGPDAEGGAVGGAVLGAAGTGGAEAGIPCSGAPPAAGTVAPPPLPVEGGGAAGPDPEGDPDGDPEAVGDAVLLAGGRVVDEAGAVTAGAVDTVGPGAEPPPDAPVVTGTGAAASAGTPSEPFATSVAAPSASTAAPSTDSTIRPGRRRVRPAVRREPGRPASGPPPGAAGPAAPTRSGSGRAATRTSGPGGAGRSRPVAGAPQPGQARAPFR